MPGPVGKTSAPFLSVKSNFKETHQIRMRLRSREQMKTSASRTGKFRQSEGAYTISEVIIAVAVVAVMFISLYVGIAFGFSVTQFDRENLRATQILLERMEGIRLFTFDQLSDTTKNPVTFTNYYYPEAVGAQSKGIEYIGTMQQVTPSLSPSATYASNMKAVTVTVQWTSGNLLRTRTMTTYAGKHGVQNYIFNN